MVLFQVLQDFSKGCITPFREFYKNMNVSYGCRKGCIRLNPKP